MSPDQSKGQNQIPVVHSSSVNPPPPKTTKTGQSNGHSKRKSRHHDKHKTETKGRKTDNHTKDTNGNTTTTQNNLSAPSPNGIKESGVKGVTENGVKSSENGVRENGRVVENGVKIGENGVIGEADLGMTSIEKKQLVELVQRNMEKHQQRQQRRVR